MTRLHSARCSSSSISTARSILSGRAGVRGMNAAFRRLYGAADALTTVPIAGRTDRAIVGDGLAAIGRAPTGAEIADAARRVSRGTAARTAAAERRTELRASRHRARCSMRWRASLGVHVGLLTGNFVRGAELKLGYFDLWRRFPFGAFGDDHLDRRDLVPVAIGAADAAAGLGASAAARDGHHRRHAARRRLRAHTRRSCAGGHHRSLRADALSRRRRRPRRADARRHAAAVGWMLARPALRRLQRLLRVPAVRRHQRSLRRRHRFVVAPPSRLFDVRVGAWRRAPRRSRHRLAVPPGGCPDDRARRA